MGRRNNGGQVISIDKLYRLADTLHDQVGGTIDEWYAVLNTIALENPSHTLEDLEYLTQDWWQQEETGNGVFRVVDHPPLSQRLFSLIQGYQRGRLLLAALYLKMGG